jgi:hypothetical protein
VFPNQTRLPARWLGVAHRVGQAMCYWLLPESGVPIARTTIKSISNEELATTEVKHILTEPVLHKDGHLIRAKVMGRKRDNNGTVIGKYNPNPLLNSAVYLTEFPDRHIQELGANALVEANL